MKTTHFDKLELTSYITDDLSTEKREALKTHLAECTECANIVQALKEEQEAFLTKMPFDTSQHQPENTLPFVSRHWKQITSVAAGLVLLLSVSFFQSARQEQPMITLKGTTDMHLFVQESDGAVLERETQVYFPGERVQITYSSPDKEYLMLFSIDVEGKLSRYEPSIGSTSAKIVAGTNMPLPHSIRLDDYLGPERFIMILSKSPLDIATIEKKVDSAFAEKGVSEFSLSLGDGVDILSTLIEKRTH